MRADTLEKYEAAKATLTRQPHNVYIVRVEAFLEKEEEWVLLFRTRRVTRGHNTNNYSEASIRVLKDIILCRTKAFNAVALVDFVAEVWERYFERRLLSHAHNCVPSHHLFYDNLLKRMPEEAASATLPPGQ